MHPVGADDLDVLIPKKKTITINGEDITFADYGFYSGLLIRSAAKEFIKELATVINGEDSEALGKIEAAFENHARVVIECVAMACGKTSQWVLGLDEKSGRMVDIAWWEICGPFFIRFAMRSLQGGKFQKMEDGLMYGRHSSDADTMLTK